MNISKVISQGLYDNLATCYKLTVSYPTRRLIGYDIKGFPTYLDVMQKQVFYGVTKGECGMRARMYLKGIQFEQHYIIRKHHHGLEGVLI